MYVPAEKVIEDAKKKEEGGGAMKNGAAATVTIPAGFQGERYRIVGMTCGLLVVVGWGAFWL